MIKNPRLLDLSGLIISRSNVVAYVPFGTAKSIEVEFSYVIYLKSFDRNTVLSESSRFT